MIRKHFRLRRKIFIGLAFATLVAAPAAQATTGFYVDGGPAPRSDATISVSRAPIASEISVQATVPQQRIASEISVQSPVAGPGITAAGAALADAANTSLPVPVAAASVSVSEGFNWSDAGIGALVAFAAALMLLTAIVLGRRYRSRPGTGLAST
jgi:hypothetical protein